MKSFWKQEPIYIRLQEILSDYWLTQKDEALVRIELHFVHRNGNKQCKWLTWFNPDLSKEEKDEAFRRLEWLDD